MQIIHFFKLLKVIGVQISKVLFSKLRGLACLISQIPLALVARGSQKNKIPERGGAGFARAPSLWDLIFLLVPYD